MELHPEVDGQQLTLRAIYDGLDRSEMIRADLENQGQEASIVPFRAPDGSEKFAVAARDIANKQPRAGIPHKYTSDWNYVRIVLSILRKILRKAETPPWYKALEVEKIHAVGSAVKWQGSVLEVSGSLLSTPIVWHALPNANHRTNLYVVRLYLEYAGLKWPPWNLQGQGVKRFYREMNTYIVESKYILQLIRRRAMVKKAWDCGFRALRIGPSRYREIDEDDLALNRRKLDRWHREVSEDFIKGLAGVGARESLKSQAPGGRKGFTDWVLAE